MCTIQQPWFQPHSWSHNIRSKKLRRSQEQVSGQLLSTSGRLNISVSVLCKLHGTLPPQHNNLVPRPSTFLVRILATFVRANQNLSAAQATVYIGTFSTNNHTTPPSRSRCYDVSDYMQSELTTFGSTSPPPPPNNFLVWFPHVESMGSSLVPSLSPRTAWERGYLERSRLKL